MTCTLAIKDLRITFKHSACNASLLTLATSGEIARTQMGIFRQYAYSTKRI
jgi:hypothetical protein